MEHLNCANFIHVSFMCQPEVGILQFGATLNDTMNEQIY